MNGNETMPLNVSQSQVSLSPSPQPPSPPPPKQQFEILGLIRGSLALAVVYLHIYGLFTKGLPSWQRNVVHTMVECFFILSGFVFVFVYEKSILNKRESAWSFAVKRFARLYPLIFVVLLFVLYWGPYWNSIPHVNATSPSPPSIWNYRTLWHFSMMVGICPEIVESSRCGGLNTPMWSLTAEVLSYIVFFIVLWIIGTITPKRGIFKNTNISFLFYLVTSIVTYNTMWTIDLKPTTGDPNWKGWNGSYPTRCKIGIGIFMGGCLIGRITPFLQKASNVLIRPIVRKVIIPIIIQISPKTTTVHEYNEKTLFVQFCSMLVFIKQYCKGIINNIRKWFINNKHYKECHRRAGYSNCNDDNNNADNKSDGNNNQHSSFLELQCNNNNIHELSDLTLDDDDSDNSDIGLIIKNKNRHNLNNQNNNNNTNLDIRQQHNQNALAIHNARIAWWISLIRTIIYTIFIYLIWNYRYNYYEQYQTIQWRIDIWHHWWVIILFATQMSDDVYPWVFIQICQFMGNISFSMYIIHFPLFKMFGSLVKSKSNFTWERGYYAINCALPFIFIIAHWSYIYFEMPMQNFLKYLLLPTPPKKDVVLSVESSITTPPTADIQVVTTQLNNKHSAQNIDSNNASPVTNINHHQQQSLQSNNSATFLLQNHKKYRSDDDDDDHHHFMLLNNQNNKNNNSNSQIINGTDDDGNFTTAPTTTDDIIILNMSDDDIINNNNDNNKISSIRG